MKQQTLNLISMVLLTCTPLVQAKTPTEITQIELSNQLPTNGNLVLGVYESGQLGDYGKNIDNNSQGGLTHAIQATGFEAKVMQSKLIPGPMGSGFDQIMLVGLGLQDGENTTLQWQEIGGNALQVAVEAFKTVPAMAFDTDSIESVANLAYGAKLGSYYFDKYYTDAERHKRQVMINVITSKVAAVKAHYMHQLDPLANAIWHTRNMSNEPANVIYPESFVAQWQAHFKGMKNIKIRVYDEQDMIKNGMGAIYGVGRGSQRPPRLMVVEYMAGEPNDAPVVVVGKGITFDTGGISLKNPPNMWNMKFDMSGAASSIGTLYALAGRQAKVNAVGIAALAENMPGAKAQRPGDVVTSMSGKTIQIRSTDAEGRLVLADGVYYGDVTYDPALLIDLATLTGSVGRALGKDYAGIFTRHDELIKDFIATGQQTGEKLWQLPLNDNHFKAIENNVADVMNSGPDAPGASAGAAFIGTFVRDTTPWIHLDIAGVAWNDKTTAIKASPGSTSFGIQLLNQYIKDHYEKD
ncbi:leucyl aminopeptidase [Marinicella litoralis]|uniref:Probable cytosol aminopeptidase n=1 Tax=Marinicella litoralis TaxID=644220 RepID=A0A4R6XS13_9GAMM|nr:leucyl aminopeptidase [Marinicella litoralis]TDR22546.1 leucyl aminopeptidase [Marinicella litoralis]